MGVWKPAFLHEFLDGNPANYRALPGELTVLPDGPIVRPTPPPEQRGFLLVPGNALNHAFTRPFTDVIGIDISLDVLRPAGVTDPLGARVTGGGGFVWQIDFIDEIARIQLRIGGDIDDNMATSVAVPGSGIIKLRTRWHTHGQAQLWIDGALRRYEPAIAPGKSITVDSLALRHRSSSIASGAPGVRARRLLVSLLRREDAADLLHGLLPIDASDALDDICLRQVAAMQAEAMNLVRAFMQATLARLTTSWREDQLGPGPFSDEAVAAHQAAQTAANDFVRFVLRRDAAAGEKFTAQIGNFLAILAAADPIGYAELVDTLSHLPDGLDPDCRAALETMAQSNAATLTPIAEVLRTVWAQAQAPGAPNV